MYDVDQGEILVDGINIKEHDLDNLRYRIGYVPQDVFLFSDTIANNILFGAHVEDRARAEQYAKHAAVYDDIKGLPEGFNTLVGERGVTLSGGQKQRLSIARAFIKDPDIIVLDDCLSAVDTKTEQEIMAYLNTALVNKTAIIITHRVHSLLNYDKIIVLENGSIAEKGTHEQLVAQKGIYYDLLQRQSLRDKEIEF
jgi:ATP-binding cassette subfamily B protein